MVIEAKPELRFLHAPLLHKGEIKMNLMTPWNGIFACLNQLHMMYEDEGAGDATTRAQHTTTIFLNHFNLLKDKTNPHFTQ